MKWILSSMLALTLLVLVLSPSSDFEVSETGKTIVVTTGTPAPDTEKKPEEDSLKLYAQSAVLMDGSTGRILYGKNEREARPMASTTKIMTCIVALEHGNLEDLVTASSNAASQPKVHLGVTKGEEIKLKDLLYSLMLESHNDAAVMIAEHVGGSVEGFAGMMNQKARDLGCSDTFFITPNGLDATVTTTDGVKREHSTTAADLGRIMKYCVTESPKKQEFLEITRTQNYFFTDAKGRRSYNCTNHNAFLTMMDGVLSGKTGFTGGAGYSYIMALENDGRVFVVALLGCGWPPHKTYKWADTKKLLDYGLDNYEYRDVFRVPDLKRLPVKKGVAQSGDLSVIPEVDLTLNLKEGEDSLKILMNAQEDVTVKTDLPKSLTAPVGSGQIVGSVTYYLDGEAIKSYPVFTACSIAKADFRWALEKAAKSYLSAAGFAIH